jgi:cytoskeletal protein RodZ
MEFQIDENLNELIEKSPLTYELIAQDLKIPVSQLKKICQGDFEGLTEHSIVDIINRINSILDTKIKVCKINKNEEIQESEDPKSKNKKLFIFKILIASFLIINILYLAYLSRDLFLCKNIIDNKFFNISIKNNGNESIFVMNRTIHPNEEINLRLTTEESIKIENNKGELIITTPHEIYKIYLENFEVNLIYGKD